METLLRKCPATGRYLPVGVVARDKEREPEVPKVFPSPAELENLSAALWRHRLHCNARDLPGQEYVRERVFNPPPDERAVRKAKTPAYSRREHVDGYFFNRPRRANDDY